MRILENVVYDGRFEQGVLDMYLPDGEGFDTIVYYHGGGLTGGHKNDYYYVDMAKSFAQNGYGFVSVEYRKYPDAKYPDFIDDCAAATKYVQDNIRALGGNGSFYVSGQSAGAYMSLMLCFNLEFFNRAGVNRDLIKGYIIDSAQPTSHFNVIQAEGEGADEHSQRIDKYAPLFYLNKDTVFPKMVLFFYEEDIPCRPEQNMLLIRAMKCYNPDVNVEYFKLAGTHCAGSTIKDEDGEYPFVKRTLEWLKK